MAGVLVFIIFLILVMLLFIAIIIQVILRNIRLIMRINTNNLPNNLQAQRLVISNNNTNPVCNNCRNKRRC